MKCKIIIKGNLISPLMFDRVDNEISHVTWSNSLFIAATFLLYYGNSFIFSRSQKRVWKQIEILERKLKKCSPSSTTEYGKIFGAIINKKGLMNYEFNISSLVERGIHYSLYHTFCQSYCGTNHFPQERKHIFILLCTTWKRQSFVLNDLSL